MIEVKNLSFGYGSHRPVFTDFSLRLATGHVTGLLGKNGTGKSTLLYLFSGLLRAQRGEVLLDGARSELRRPELLSELYLVPEEFDLPSVTLAQYVRLYAPLYPRFSAEVLRQCLEDFELPGDLNLGRLSMGQKKKAYMSFALATQTRYLFMDEPTNGLDIPSKSRFRQAVARGMSPERLVVVSTHQVRDVETLLDHVVMLDGSRLLCDAGADELCRRLRFEERAVGEPVDDSLYCQRTLRGNMVIVPNPGQEQGPLDLELLFNALLERPGLLAQG